MPLNWRRWSRDIWITEKVNYQQCKITASYGVFFTVMKNVTRAETAVKLRFTKRVIIENSLKFYERFLKLVLD